MTVAVAALECPVCHADLPPQLWNAAYETYCPGCRRTVAVAAFPAIARRSAGVAAEPVTEGAEASCFYHPGKRAAVACDVCGRYLCSLCQVELSGSNWCPACIERQKSQGKLQSLENRRTLYDNIALALATLPALFVWTSLIGAPIALFVTVRYWRAPLSIVPRTRIRFMIAAVLAVVELGLWGALIAGLVVALRNR